jgi:hypothetical protein
MSSGTTARWPGSSPATTGVTIALSGMSSKARGVDGETMNGVELAQPTKLVELAAWAERTLVY